MSEIISLFTIFSPHLSATTLRQLCEIDNIAEHLGTIGAIHYTSNQIRPG